MKSAYPQLQLTLNGGVKTMEDIKTLLPKFGGLMIGRQAYQNPWFLVEIEREIFGRTDRPAREDIARAMIPYIEQQARDHGTPLKSITRHMIGLYQGQPGARRWRRTLSEATGSEDPAQLIEAALPS